MGRRGAVSAIGLAKEGLRRVAKGVFAAADLFFGGFEGPRILIYHQIEAGLGRQMEVTKRAFVAQLDWLADNGDVVDLDTAVAQRGRPDSRHDYVLTFDDGYDDFFRHGFPELERRGMPFVLYLTTHPVETGEPLFPGGGADPLTWDQVERMAASGLMTLGAHTHRHLDFRRLDSAAAIEELDRSNELIERRMGVVPRHFAYPWGYWAQPGHAAVADRYATATLGTGAPITADSDPLLLNRVAVQLSDGVFFFRRKMKRGMRLEDVVRRRITGYRGP
jgi:peptidoglycan/xylan/chitin deacetylase (PgdA/CDA1 family)